MRRTFYIWTIGCQMNQADSDRLATALEFLGYRQVESPKDAEVVVVNSCVVRQQAEDRVVSKVWELKPLKRRDPRKVITLMGCMVSPKNKEELKARFPHVDLFLRPQEYEPLLDLLKDRGCVEQVVDPFSLIPRAIGPTAYVPIIHGCNKVCTYCIIPYRRGKERSRPIEEIRREVQGLVWRGVKEVTLLGQNVDSYGHDLPGRPDLADLFYALNEIEGLKRIRFLTSHPSDMSDRIIQAVADLDKVCEHFNVPVQAGDDEVLRRMRRGYTVHDYRKLIAKIREKVPGCSLATDIIVGFSGETEEQFQHTLDLLAEIRFDVVHVARYSPRPGTFGAKFLPDDVPPEEKKRRHRAVEELQERIAAEINARLLGQTVEVLVEGRQKDKWYGRTRTNKLVFFPAEGNLLGELVQVRIEKTSPWALQGAIVVPAAVA